MGVIPAANNAVIFFATSASVSFQYCRRSLWPTMQYCTPMLASMPALTSPV